MTTKKDHVEDDCEYAAAESMFIYSMVKIRHLATQEGRSARILFEVGNAYHYYEQIIQSRYLTSKKNPNGKMVLALCKEYDGYLDTILPLRKILKNDTAIEKDIERKILKKVD